MDKGYEKKMDFPVCREPGRCLCQRFPVFFPGKSYNLDSLTVGTTEDPTVSRMTIGTLSVMTKPLNRSKSS